MIYPKTFEQKIGFDKIRLLLKERCLCTLGKEETDNISFSDDSDVINEWQQQTREFRRLKATNDDFPMQYFFDMRPAVARLRLEGTHIEENELFDLRRSLETIYQIVKYLRGNEKSKEDIDDMDDEGYLSSTPYHALYRLTEEVVTFPQLIRRIDSILDKYGKIKDTASPTLLEIRQELAKTEGSISRILNSILRKAQSEGHVEKDVTPAMRDGRLVIPVAPAMKKKIKGIVHDESATGKTIFIEPTEVVEANNRIRELEADERREIIRILTAFSNELRPHVSDILQSYIFLGKIDLIQAKAQLAEYIHGYEPVVGMFAYLDWIQAVHPLLRISLEKQGKKVVPLDITLSREKRILIISGPNAGGKSVCLKTTGLLQYMLQCGLSVPMSERSKTGIFQHILIDIGDEQSIENDLSTYSSHLLNMKNMMKTANQNSLILIDEFGTGTEPRIGGAIAESVLNQFCKKETWGIITTHYQNLKQMADTHPIIANGAMLYDRQEMRPLFQLQIGQPGSSFAIEIARKIGLPEDVIKEASEIVGNDYVQSDKYLQDIVRDKRYWENKRQNIHQHEKQMQSTIARYESEVEKVDKERKEILRKAKEEAEELLRESNRRIENAIREIKESQAAKEETRRIREELNTFREEIAEVDTTANDELIAKKIRQIQERHERKAKRKLEKQKRQEEQQNTPQQPVAKATEKALKEGQTVRIKGLSSVGKIEKIQGKMATVIFGDMRTTMRSDRLEPAEAPKKEESKALAVPVSRQTRETIDERKLNFKQDLDVRGMRGDEAINAVTYFIDDAILLGMNRVRILHGTGSGILRSLIRQYLATIPNVTHFQDEHVQFGGHGITVVDIG